MFDKNLRFKSITILLREKFTSINVIKHFTYRYIAFIEKVLNTKLKFNNCFDYSYTWTSLI